MEAILFSEMLSTMAIRVTGILTILGFLGSALRGRGGALRG